MTFAVTEAEFPTPVTETAEGEALNQPVEEPGLTKTVTLPDVVLVTVNVWELGEDPALVEKSNSDGLTKNCAFASGANPAAAKMKLSLTALERTASLRTRYMKLTRS